MVKVNLLPFFFKLINYKKTIVQSYKKIRKKNINLLTKINNELMNEELISLNEYEAFNINKLNITFEDFKVSIRQYYYTKLFNFRLNKFYLIFMGLNLSLIYPLPKKYLIILNKYIKVNFFLSGISYYFLLLYEISKTFIHLIKLFLKSKDFEYINFSAYFFNIKYKNLVTSRYNNLGLVKYAFNNFLNNKNIFIHSVKNFKNNSLKYSKLPFKLEYSNKKITKLLIFFFNFIKTSIIKKNYSLIFFLREISISFLLKDQKKNCFHDSYYFSHDNFYRPLWTYIAENKGSMIYIYFYSLNNEYTQFKKNYFDYNTPLSLYTWNNFYVWSASHKKYLKKIIPYNSKNKFYLKPPVSFFTNDRKIHEIPKVLTFDIAPHSLINYATYGKPYEYELFWKTSNLFLKDIFILSEKLNFKFGLKIKRLNNLVDKKYLKLINSLTVENNFILFNDSYSPEQIISSNSIVICFPFTSSAYFAKKLNAKCIYYDPLNTIKNNELNDIKLISTLKSLNKYLVDNL